MSEATEYLRGRGPHFAPIPFELLDDPRADAYTIATYAAVKSYADFGSTNGAAVSDAVACQRAGCGERTFRERRQLLRDLGWLDWQTVATQHGRINRYVVHSSPPPADDTIEMGGPAPDAGPIRQEMPDGSGARCRQPRASYREPVTETDTASSLRSSAGASADVENSKPNAEALTASQRSVLGRLIGVCAEVGLGRSVRAASQLKAMLAAGLDPGELELAIRGLRLLPGQPGVGLLYSAEHGTGQTWEKALKAGILATRQDDARTTELLESVQIGGIP